MRGGLGDELSVWLRAASGSFSLARAQTSMVSKGLRLVAVAVSPIDAAAALRAPATRHHVRAGSTRRQVPTLAGAVTRSSAGPMQRKASFGAMFGTQRCVGRHCLQLPECLTPAAAARDAAASVAARVVVLSADGNRGSDRRRRGRSHDRHDERSRSRSRSDLGRFEPQIPAGQPVAIVIVGRALKEFGGRELVQCASDGLSVQAELEAEPVSLPLPSQARQTRAAVALRQCAR